MKLTRNRLKELIRESIKERAMLLTETTLAKARQRVEVGMETFAVFSSHRGERSARENKPYDDKVRDYLTKNGWPYTVVEGGFKEIPRDESGEEIEGAEKTSEIEKSYWIFEQDIRPDIKKSGTLFNIASKVAQMTDQESFSYGYARTVTDDSGQEEQEMYIAVYPAGATKSGPEARIKEPWAGPWHTLADMEKSDGYYTKIRNSKLSFKEEIEDLRESLKHTNSKIKKRRIHHKIQILQRFARS
jgi:hypothetical protein